MNRREFLKGVIGTGTTIGIGVSAVKFFTANAEAPSTCDPEMDDCTNNTLPSGSTVETYPHKGEETTTTVPDSIPQETTTTSTSSTTTVAETTTTTVPETTTTNTVGTTIVEVPTTSTTVPATMPPETNLSDSL